MIPEALKIIYRKIKIKSDGFIPPFNPIKFHCDDSYKKKPSLKITTKYHEENTAADYLLYVGVVEDRFNDFFAYASFCVKGSFFWIYKKFMDHKIICSDSNTNRPLVGYIILNEDKVSYSDGRYQMHISTFIHEVLHALYFHPKAFKFYPPNSKNQPFLLEDKQGLGYLQGDNIVREAREHYNCKSLNKGNYIIEKWNNETNEIVPLEDQTRFGSVGSHFEKQICGNEMMVSDGPLISIFSKMSLAVALDSGWFFIDMESAEQYDWGRKRGCRMFDQSYLDLEEDPIEEFCEMLPRRRLAVQTWDSSINANEARFLKKIIWMCSINPVIWKSS